MTSREEHLKWCKERAREYLDRGDVVNAFASMSSDLGKHEETRSPGAALTGLGLLCVHNRDLEGMRRWIEGFN